MASGNGFTPTEKRIMDLLGSGNPITKSEIEGRLKDYIDVDGSAVDVHLSNIRSKLRRKGLDILGQYIKNCYHVRLVRLLASPYDGRES